MTVDMACTVLTLFSSPALTSGSCFSKPAEQAEYERTSHARVAMDPGR